MSNASGANAPDVVAVTAEPPMALDTVTARRRLGQLLRLGLHLLTTSSEKPKASGMAAMVVGMAPALVPVWERKIAELPEAQLQQWLQSLRRMLLAVSVSALDDQQFFQIVQEEHAKLEAFNQKPAKKGK